MPKDQSDIVRASEIATYCFCQRAWSYQRQGVPSQNLSDMTEGSQYHHHHGKTLSMIQVARAAAFVLIILAIIVLLLR
jgi:hypothetical protein